MGWLRLVAFLKSYVSFAEYRLFYGALLQKRPRELGHRMLFENEVMTLQMQRAMGCSYGVATIGSVLKIICLFCRISSLLWGSFAKETYDLKEPTNRSHPISCV